MRFYQNNQDGMPYYEAKPQNWYRFDNNGTKVFGCYADSTHLAWAKFFHADKWNANLFTPNVNGNTIKVFKATI